MLGNGGGEFYPPFECTPALLVCRNQSGVSPIGSELCVVYAGDRAP
ncbi:MAG: hypothetical protein ACJA0P_003233 [Planctomycetota bacterium]